MTLKLMVGPIFEEITGYTIRNASEMPMLGQLNVGIGAIMVLKYHELFMRREFYVGWIEF